MRHGMILSVSILALCAACQSDNDWNRNRSASVVDYRSLDYYGPETPSGMAGARSINDNYYAAEYPAGRDMRWQNKQNDPVGYERDSVGNARTTEASYYREDRSMRDDRTLSADRTPSADRTLRDDRDARDNRNVRDNTKLPATERTFLEKAAQCNMLEIESSQLALDKGVSGNDRTFAKMMVEDHAKANRELADLCRDKGCSIPSTLDAEDQRKLDDLRGLDGAAFTRAYHELQVKGHDKAIALFEDAARECENPQVRSFASRTLPTLREHRAALDKTSDSGR